MNTTYIVDDGDISVNELGSSAHIVNTGFIWKMSGTERAVVSGPVITHLENSSHSGTLRVNGGGTNKGTGRFRTSSGATLEIQGLDWIFEDGASVFGDGETEWEAPMTTLASATASLDNLTLGVGGNLGGSGTFVFENSDNLFENGALSGDAVSRIPSGSVLTVVGNGVTTIRDTHEIHVESGGTILVRDTDSGFWSNGNGLLRNEGIVDFLGDGNIFQNGPHPEQAMTINNASGGLFLKSGGTGTTSIVATIESAGTWRVESGVMALFRESVFSGPVEVEQDAVLEFGGTDSSWESGTSFTGDGWVHLASSLRVTIPQGVTVSADNFSLEKFGPGLYGEGTLKIAEAGAWKNGRLEDSITVEIEENVELSIEGNGAKTFGFGSTPTLVNRGSVVVRDDAVVSNNGAASIQNIGTLDFASNGDFTAPIGRTIDILNTGDLVKSGGLDTDGDTHVRANLVHRGTMDIQSGLFGLDGNHSIEAPITIQPGARFRLRGSSLNSTLLRDGASIGGGGAFEHQAGTIEVEGGTRVLVEGYETLNSGGTVTGEGTFVINSDETIGRMYHRGVGVTEIPEGVTVTTGGELDIDDGRVIRILGTLDLASSFVTTSSNDARIENMGTMLITGNSNINFGSGEFSILNEGDIICQIPAGTYASLPPKQYSGDGTLRIETGRLRLTEGVSLTGRVEILEDAELNCFNLGLAAGAVVRGVGLLNGNIAIGGSVRPGLSIGTLNVTGGVSFDEGGEIEIELESGANDLLEVTNIIDLTDGSIRLSLPAGYEPTSGESWNIATANSITGDLSKLVQSNSSSGFGYFFSSDGKVATVTYSAVDSFRKALESATGNVVPADLSTLAGEDLDGDGLTNLLDWALGGSLSASDPDRGLAVTSVVEGNPRIVNFRYPTNALATEAVLTIEGDSEINGAYVTIDHSLTGTQTENGILYQLAAISLPASDESEFFKLQAALVD